MPLQLASHCSGILLIVEAAMKFYEYSGMSYEQASREAARLLARDGWFRSFDRLSALYEIMRGGK